MVNESPPMLVCPFRCVVVMNLGRTYNQEHLVPVSNDTSDVLHFGAESMFI